MAGLKFKKPEIKLSFPKRNEKQEDISSKDGFKKALGLFYSFLFNFGGALRNIRIRYRLIGSFLILSLVPLIVTGIISFNSSSEAITNNNSTYSIQLMNQVSKNTELELSRYRSISDDLSFSTEIQQLAGYDNMSTWEAFNTNTTITNSLSRKLGLATAIRDVSIAMNNGQIIGFGNFLTSNQFWPEKDRNDLVQAIADKKGEIVWNIDSHTDGAGIEYLYRKGH